MRVLIFAGDLSDPAQQRRISALKSIGHELQIVGFRKSEVGVEGIGTHLDLGRVYHQRLVLRLVRTLFAVLKIHKYMRRNGRVDLIYARNLDMVLLAWIMTCLTWMRVGLVYECLDIHGVFTNGGAKQFSARKLERFLLRRITRLVVSSPDFISQYFAPIQRYDGDWLLLENKLWSGVLNKVRPSLKAVSKQHKIRVGWVGNIRCQPSFDILMKLADKRAFDVEVHIHGTVHEHAILHFQHHIAARENVFFHGGYAYPTDLDAIYRDLDLVWSQDMWHS